MNLFMVMLHTLYMDEEVVKAEGGSLLFDYDFAWVWLAQVLNHYASSKYSSGKQHVPDIIIEAVSLFVAPLPGADHNGSADADKSILDMLQRRFSKKLPGLKKQLARGIHDALYIKTRPEYKNSRACMSVLQPFFAASGIATKK